MGIIIPCTSLMDVSKVRKTGRRKHSLNVTYNCYYLTKHLWSAHNVQATDCTSQKMRMMMVVVVVVVVAKLRMLPVHSVPLAMISFNAHRTPAL